MTNPLTFNAAWCQSNADDRKDGMEAYRRYRRVIQSFASYYGFPLKDVVSAFVALSPNSDYHGNLRSLASVLNGVRLGVPLEDITVSTYNQCRNRAYGYVTGKFDFLKTVRGPKISAFRDNIIRPNTSRMVTVDGHMIALFHGRDLTMKEAARLLSSGKQYREIADNIATLAAINGMAPCQMQATLWFARKRLLGIKYNPQTDMFDAANDSQKTICKPQDFPPYERRGAAPKVRAVATPPETQLPLQLTG